MDVCGGDRTLAFAWIILLEIVGEKLELGRENSLFLSYIEQSIYIPQGG